MKAKEQKREAGTGVRVEDLKLELEGLGLVRVAGFTGFSGFKGLGFEGLGLRIP